MMGFHPCRCRKGERCSFSQPQTSTLACTCIKTQFSQNTHFRIAHNRQHQTNTNADAPTQGCTRTQAKIYTLVVLSPLLVLTAHQSPVAACRNMLTPAISLKSLSIRSSCAGPSTLYKPRVRYPPTYTHIHTIRAFTQTSTCERTNEGTYCMLTLYLHKAYCTHTHKMRIRRLHLPIMHIHAVGSH